jgi:peptide/nickel transport system substrate-binding protein
MSGRTRKAATISLATTWLDPAEAAGIITPYMVYYALHDAMVKAMPDNSKRQAHCFQSDP